MKEMLEREARTLVKKKTLLQLTEQDSDIIWTSVSQN